MQYEFGLGVAAVLVDVDAQLVFANLLHEGGAEGDVGGGEPRQDVGALPVGLQ